MEVSMSDSTFEEPAQEPALVAAIALDGHGGGRELSWEEARASRPEDGVLWLHFDHAADGTRAWLLDESGLDEVVAEALLAEEPRPRSLPAGDGLLVILRAINAGDDADPEDMVALRAFFSAHRVITLRHRAVRSVRDVRAQVAAGAGPISAGDLLHDIVDGMLSRIGQAVAGIEELADELEDAVLETGGREVRSKLSDLRRQAIALRRYVAPQRDAIARLPAERVAWLSDLDRARLREEADRITRFVEDLDAARDRAAVTHEELANRLAEQMNRTTYVLTLVAGIFLPLGLITGLLGINVGGIPGTQSPFAFWLVTGLLVLVAAAELAWFRRKRML
jgi:zinc transporter